MRNEILTQTSRSVPIYEGAQCAHITDMGVISPNTNKRSRINFSFVNKELEEFAWY
jgi:hypothetical protein